MNQEHFEKSMMGLTYKNVISSDKIIHKLGHAVCDMVDKCPCHKERVLRCSNCAWCQRTNTLTIPQAIKVMERLTEILKQSQIDSL